VKNISRPEGDVTITVELADVMMAQKALSYAKEIGNKLEALKLPRPTPGRPRMCEVLSHTLTVRAGRTLKSDISNILPQKRKKKDEPVIANRTKVRRARLREKEKGIRKNVGVLSHTLTVRAGRTLKSAISDILPQ